MTMKIKIKLLPTSFVMEGTNYKTLLFELIKIESAVDEEGNVLTTEQLVNSTTLTFPADDIFNLNAVEVEIVNQ